MATGGPLLDAAIYLGAAVVAVPVSKRLGLGSVVGYLLAGVAIGPFGLRLIGDAESTLHFSEFGVVLLLFLIGLELNPARLWAMRHAIFGLGALQVVVSTLAIGAVASIWIDDMPTLFIVSSALALSSTAMAMQLVDEKHLRTSPAGQSAFAVLLFQDLAVIPLLALLPLLATSGPGAADGGGAGAVTVIGVIAAIIIGGRYLARYAFRAIARTGLRELFTAFSLLLVIGISLAMTAVGLSMALGAFLAGVVLADSEYRQQLELEIEPFKGLLMGLFFIAVGMSTDLGMVMRDPLGIALIVVGVVSLKFVVLVGLGMLFRQSTHESLLFAALVSQVGEFAFVIFGLAERLQVIDPTVSQPLVVAVSLSMLLTPLVIVLIERVIARRLAPDARDADTPDDDAPVILVGAGRVGQVISRMLTANGIGATIIDNDPDQVELSRRYANRAYYGDATRLDLLEAAGIANARILIVASDVPETTLEIVDKVREHWPDVTIAARARNRTHAYALFERGVTLVERETFYSSLALTERILREFGYSEQDAYDAVALFRSHDEDMLRRLFELRGEPDLLRESTIQARRDFEQLMTEEIERRRATDVAAGT